MQAVITLEVTGHNTANRYAFSQVEIISVDKSYSTDKKVMDPNYNPKVATWGVFERPANISEAYGGGRTIEAGTPLEDAAATQARKERIAAALSRSDTTSLVVCFYLDMAVLASNNRQPCKLVKAICSG